jgi:hypothetical protein
MDLRGRLSPRSALALVFAALLVGSAAAQAGMVINDDSDVVQTPEIVETELTKSSHTVGNMSLTEYQADDGAVETLNAHINKSVEEPITLRADRIDADAYDQFPRKSGETGANSASALDASEWSADTSGSAGSGSVSDVELVDGVSGVQVSTSSQGSGDTSTFTYDNFSIDTDANARHAQFVLNVATLDSGASVTLAAVDADGDEKQIMLDSSLSSSDDNVAATGTGDGIVYQQELGTLSTAGSGDGSMDGIEKLTVDVTDADADIRFAAVNLEKKSDWTFGEYKNDSTGEMDDIVEPSGEFSVTSLDTLGSEFDGSEIHQIAFPVVYGAGDLPTSAQMHKFSDADQYQGYDQIAHLYYRLEVPSAYELSHSGLSLQDTVDLPANRYKVVEYAEGVGDTEFENISTWNAATGSYSSQGKNVTLDTTIEPGSAIAYHASYPVTSQEKNTMLQTAGAAAGGGASSGGLGSIPIIGGILAVVFGAFKKLSGGN